MKLSCRVSIPTNTFPNINQKNNIFRYKKDDSAWKEVKLPIGSYEIAGIREETFRQVGKKTDIVFTSNRNMLKCTVYIEKGYSSRNGLHLPMSHINGC